MGSIDRNGALYSGSSIGDFASPRESVRLLIPRARALGAGDAEDGVD